MRWATAQLTPHEQLFETILTTGQWTHGHVQV